MHHTESVANKSVMHVVTSAGLLLSLLTVSTPALAHHAVGDHHSQVELAMGEEPSSSGVSSTPVKALYDTKAEAEKAASLFNCKGAHQMGAKWMPCSGHNHGSNAGH